MTENHGPRSISASRISLAQLMQPEHANISGNVHGGWIMKLVDEAGALAAMRHAGHRVVTVAIDSFVFRQPIRIGDLVILDAEVTYTGRTSMEVEVQVQSENPITGLRALTNTAYLVYVALDAEGHPTTVRPIKPETPEEERKMAEGRDRQERRLARR
ncbi:MAG: acyl-CoA thioesterase [Bacteroidota bacterium]